MPLMEDIQKFALISKIKIKDCIKKLTEPYGGVAATKTQDHQLLNKQIDEFVGGTSFIAASLFRAPLVMKYIAQFKGIGGISAETGSIEIVEEASEPPPGTYPILINIKPTEKKQDGKPYLEYEGWNQKDFLTIHSRFLLERCVLLRKELNVLVKNPLPSVSLIKEKLLSVEALENELWISVNALLSFHLYTQAVNESNTILRDQLLSDFTTHFLKSLTDALSTMAHGDELTLPCGSTHHATYLTFIRFNDDVLIRFDNVGLGIEKFPGLVDTTKQVTLCILTQIPINEIVKNKSLFDYIKQVCLVCNDAEDNALAIIYNKDSKIPLPQAKVDKFYPKVPQQFADNCVAESYALGIRYRLYEIGGSRGVSDGVDWLLGKVFDIGFGEIPDTDKNPYKLILSQRRGREAQLFNDQMLLLAKEQKSSALIAKPQSPAEALRQIYFDPPLPDPFFVPTTHAKNLHDLWDKGVRRIAITGIPGCGKTELAKYFAHKFLDEKKSKAFHPGTSDTSLAAQATVLSQSRERFISMDEHDDDAVSTTSAKSIMAFWLEADNELTLSKQLEQLAKFLRIPESRANEQWDTFFPRISRLISNALRSYPDSLIILNNVRNYQAIQSLLNELQPIPIRLLVTTQKIDFFNEEPGLVPNLNISDGMGVEEGYSLLTKIVPNLKKNGVAELVNDVGGLPIALTLIGFYMLKKRLIDIDNYRKEAKKVSLLRRELRVIADKTKYGKDVHMALYVPIHEIMSTNSDAAELLLLISFLHPDSIKKSFLKEYLKQKRPKNKDEDEDNYEGNIESTLFDCFELFKNYGILKSSSEETETFDMHRLVQEEVYYYYKEHGLLPPSVAVAGITEIKDSKEVKTILPVHFKRMLNVMENLLPEEVLQEPPVAKALLPHFDSLVTNLRRLAPESEELANAEVTLANGYRYQGGKTFIFKAIQHLETALEIYKKFPDKCADDAVQTINNIGLLYYNLRDPSRYLSADKCFQEALATQESRLGKTHPEIAVYLNNLGDLYNDWGPTHREQAITYHKRALDIRREDLKHALSEGKENLGKYRDYCQSLNGLANVYINIGGKANFEQSIVFLKEALTTAEKKLIGNVIVANILNSLGRAYVLLGGSDNLQEAVKYLEKALPIVQKKLGEKHFYTGRTHNNIASAYQELEGDNNLQKAIDHYTEALKIFEAQWGPDHSEVAMVLNNLGELYQKRGGTDNLKIAEDYHKQALKIRLQHQEGEVSQLNLAQSYSNLASIYRLGDKTYLQVAVEYNQKALIIFEKYLGKDSSKTKATQNNLAKIMAELTATEPKSSMPLIPALVTTSIFQASPAQEQTTPLQSGQSQATNTSTSPGLS